MNARMSKEDPRKYQPEERITAGAARANTALKLIRDSGLKAWYSDLSIDQEGTVVFTLHIPGEAINLA